MEAIHFLIDQYNDDYIAINNEISEYEKAIKNLKKTSYIDENKSVRWNKDEIARLINDEQIKINTANKKLLDARLSIVEYIKDCIKNDFDLTDRAVEIIYDRAYSDGHSYGFYDVYSRAIEYGEFVRQILDSSN